MPTTHPEPTTYSRAALAVQPTLRARYLPQFPYRVVHWYSQHGQYDGCETLGHYRTRDEAEQALTRLSRP